jgi:hypothetical protein
MRLQHLIKLTVLAVPLVALGCRTPGRIKPEKPPPTWTPAAVLQEAARMGASFAGTEFRVSGLVIESGGGTAIKSAQLDAGNGQHLSAVMKAYHCLGGVNGICVKEPPAVGAQATLDCIGEWFLDTPLLKACTVVEVAS